MFQLWGVWFGRPCFFSDSRVNLEALSFFGGGCLFFGMVLPLKLKEDSSQRRLVLPLKTDGLGRFGAIILTLWSLFFQHVAIGQKENPTGTIGFGLFFLLPGFLRYPVFLTQSEYGVLGSSDVYLRLACVGWMVF